MPEPTGLHTRLVAGDLQAVDPKADLDFLRQFVAQACENRWALDPFFQALALRDPLALVELATGPRAPVDLRLVQAACGVIDVLEKNVAPNGLYRRLLALGGPPMGVLELAAQRNPGASWVLSLSEKAGEMPVGRVHLLAASSHPAFASVCWAHAAAGHDEALAQVARQLGRPEPLAASIHHGRVDDVLPLLGELGERPGFLETALPWLSGVWGPDLDSLFVRVVPSLGPLGRHTLEPLAARWPRTRALLAFWP